MKNYLVVILLLVNLLLSFKPFYSECNLLLNNTEKQLEEVSLSEIYFCNSNKINTAFKIINRLPKPVLNKYQSHNLNLNLTTLKTHPNTAKSGRQVLFSCFLI